MKAFDGLIQGAATIFRREPWWAEFWSAMTAVMWSSLSFASMGALQYWPSMRVLTELGGDRFWHVAGVGMGAMQFLFLLCDQRWLRWGAAIGMCWFWGVLTLGVWVATPWAPAVAIYAGWCGINLFSILRLLRHHG